MNKHLVYICREEYPEDVYWGQRLKDVLQSNKALQKHLRDKQDFASKGVYLEHRDTKVENWNALLKSEWVILICSRHTKNSERIRQVIETFKNSGEERKILAFLIEGEPFESFPETFYHETLLENEMGESIVQIDEPLAADIRAPKRKKANRLLKVEQLRLVASIVGCTFDDLYNRKEKLQRRRMLLYLTIITMLVSVYGTVLTIRLVETITRVQISKEQNDTYAAAINQLFIELPMKFKDDPQALAILESSKREMAAITRLSGSMGIDLTPRLTEKNQISLSERKSLASFYKNNEEYDKAISMYLQLKEESIGDVIWENYFNMAALFLQEKDNHGFTSGQYLALIPGVEVLAGKLQTGDILVDLKLEEADMGETPDANLILDSSDYVENYMGDMTFKFLRYNGKVFDLNTIVVNRTNMGDLYYYVVMSIYI